MANPPILNRNVLVRFMLCLLVGCLAMHFLVEDAFLFAGFASLVSKEANAEHLLFDEIEHQDDLVFLPELPENVTDDGVSSIMVWTMSLIKQIPGPILPPPKI